MRLLVVILALLVVVGAATGSSARHHLGQSCYDGFVATRGVSIVRTPCSIAGGASTSASVVLNGAIPSSCWADSELQFECGWHGLLLNISLTRAAGPATIQVASSRWDRVRVGVIFTWRR